jgi:hypothetical protein
MGAAKKMRPRRRENAKQDAKNAISLFVLFVTFVDKSLLSQRRLERWMMCKRAVNQAVFSASFFALSRLRGRMDFWRSSSESRSAI